MKYSEEKITPAIAERYLKHNYGNRAIKPTWVAHLTTLILTGFWLLHPHGIVFTKSGRLVDGQHRLYAIIQAGCAAWMVVCRNAADEVYPVLDTGAKRSLADSMGGEVTQEDIATLRCLLKLIDTGFQQRPNQATIGLGKLELGGYLAKFVQPGKIIPASIKAAFTLAAIAFPNELDELKEQFTHYVMQHQEMWKQLWAVRKAQNERAHGTHDRFVLTLKLFNALAPARRDVSKLSTADLGLVRSQALALLGRVAPDFTAAAMQEQNIYSTQRNRLTHKRRQNQLLLPLDEATESKAAAPFAEDVTP